MHSEHMAAAIHAAGRGESVLVVAPTSAEARAIFEHMEPVVANVKGAALRRTNGSERVTFESGGVLRLVGLDSSGHRGVSADRVFLPISTPADVVLQVTPCIVTRPAGVLVGY